jgi:hypothetical protein
MVTDELSSYGAALGEVATAKQQETGRCLHKRTEDHSRRAEGESELCMASVACERLRNPLRPGPSTQPLQVRASPLLTPERKALPSRRFCRVAVAWFRVGSRVCWQGIRRNASGTTAL